MIVHGTKNDVKNQGVSIIVTSHKNGVIDFRNQRIRILKVMMIMKDGLVAQGNVFKNAILKHVRISHNLLISAGILIPIVFGTGTIFNVMLIVIRRVLSAEIQTIKIGLRMKVSGEKSNLSFSHGWQRFPILVAFVLINELTTGMFRNDFGAMLWVLFHFFVNPICCLLYIVFTIVKIKRSNSLKNYLWDMLSIFIAIWFIYIAISGNIAWVEMLGIDFGEKMG
jgi:hypothetical protein